MFCDSSAKRFTQEDLRRKGLDVENNKKKIEKYQVKFSPRRKILESFLMSFILSFCFNLKFESILRKLFFQLEKLKLQYI